MLFVFPFFALESQCFQYSDCFNMEATTCILLPVVPLVKHTMQRSSGLGGQREKATLGQQCKDYYVSYQYLLELGVVWKHQDKIYKKSCQPPFLAAWQEVFSKTSFTSLELFHRDTYIWFSDVVSSQLLYQRKYSLTIATERSAAIANEQVIGFQMQCYKNYFSERSWSSFIQYL